MPIYIHLGNERKRWLDGCSMRSSGERIRKRRCRRGEILHKSEVCGISRDQCDMVWRLAVRFHIYIFSDRHEVSEAVPDLSIVLSISILLNIIQPILCEGLQLEQRCRLFVN